MTRALTFFALCAGVLVTGGGQALALEKTKTLDDCDAWVRDSPDDPDAYVCYYAVARRNLNYEDATRRLDALLQIHPDRSAAMRILGLLERARRNPRWEKLFRDAADTAHDRGEPGEEIIALLTLARFLGRDARLDEADEVLARALPAAEATGDPVNVAQVLTKQAFQARRRYDNGRAQRLFHEAEALAFPDGSIDLKMSILNGLGGTYLRLVRYEDALRYYRGQADLARQSGAIFNEASPRYNIALVATMLQRDDRIEPAEVDRLIGEALDVAIEARNTRLEGASRMLLGERLSGPDAIEQYELAMAASTQAGDGAKRLWAMYSLAKEKIRLSPEQPEEGFALLEQAIAEARARGDRVAIAHALFARAYSARLVDLPRERWIPWHLEAIDATEKIRDLQPEGTVRTRVFARHVPVYYAFSGFLLDGLDSSPDPEADLELAFRTMERMRARVLLDTLDASGSSQPSRDEHPLHASRDAVLREVSRIQKRLVNRKVTREERDELLAELAEREAEEAGLRDQLARDDLSFGALRSPEIPSLADARAVLSEDQALLVYQTANPLDPHRPNEFNGSWVVVATRDRLEIVPLPRRSLLRKKIDPFPAVLERRDGSSLGGSVGLYRDLLSGAMDHLPSQISRLVVVPDDALHRLPMGALRPDEDAPPLASTHELSYAPSVTAWMRWKKTPDPRADLAVLALADPALSFEDPAAESRGAGVFGTALDLGSLPNARREVRTMNRLLGGGNQILIGEGASEAAMKQADLKRFKLIHLAAHAVVDDQYPQRSAVLLSPGSPEEDGLLQFREIVDLNLDGQIVVLTACRGASGPVLGGEGVMGLAQAFFRAGARAVVAGLWPLRDDEVATLTEGFARHLARGDSVAVALAEARRDRIDDGTPPAAWAGLVVLGDGDLVPFPGGTGRSPTWLLWVIPSAATLAFAVMLLWRLRPSS